MAAKKPPQPEPKKSSFRMTLGKGQVWTTSEMRSMLMRAVDQIEANGITHLKACNLYVPPVDEAGNPVVRVMGEALKDVVIAAPYRSVAEEYGL